MEVSDFERRYFKTVYIITSLGTHLALPICHVETVSELKERIRDEHPRCFLDIGEIQVHALKVERRGMFFHLPDSVPVRVVFEDTTESWFLNVDVSAAEKLKEQNGSHLKEHPQPISDLQKKHRNHETPENGNSLKVKCMSNEKTSKPEGKDHVSGMQKSVVENKRVRASKEQSHKCENVTDKQIEESRKEASEPQPSAKKKRKFNEEKRSIYSVSNEETLNPKGIPQHLIVAEQKIKDINKDDLSTEPCEDTYSVKTDSRKRKRRREEKTSSNTHDHDKGENPHLRVNAEEEHAKVHSQELLGAKVHELSPGDPIRGMIDNNEVLPSFDVSLINAEADTVTNDVCKEADTIKAKRVGNIEDHSADYVNGHAFPMNESFNRGEDKLIRHDNVILENYQKSGSDETDKVKEQREMSKNDPEAVMSGATTLSNQGADESIRGVTVNLNTLSATEVIEPKKSGNKKRKTKKRKDSGEPSPLTKGIEHVDAAQRTANFRESHGTLNNGRASGNTQKQENVFCQREEKEAPAMDRMDSLHSVTERENGCVNENDTGSLEGNIKVDAKAEKVKKKKNKSRKKQVSSSLNLLTEDQCFDHKEPSISSDCRTQVDITNKNKSSIKHAPNKSEESNLELEQGIQAKTYPQLPEVNYRSSGCSHVLSDAPEDICKGRPLEVNVNANHSKSSCTDEIYKHMEVSHENFVPEHNQNDSVDGSNLLLYQMNTKGKVNDELMSEKDETVPKVTEEKSPDGNFSIVQPQKLLSKDGQDAVRLHFDKKLPVARKTRKEALSSRNSCRLNSTAEEKKRPEVVEASGTMMQLEKSSEYQSAKTKVQTTMNEKHSAVTRQALRDDTSNVLNNSAKKCLSVTSGAIFKHDSSESSEDEGTVDSDASTRTPSDDSVSSDYSDGVNNADLHTPKNDGKKRQDTKWRKLGKTNLLDKGEMSIRDIFASSRTYKKAKLTASQMEDTESQPDLVPESQAA